jgi:hypothetical protein
MVSLPFLSLSRVFLSLSRCVVDLVDLVDLVVVRRAFIEEARAFNLFFFFLLIFLFVFWRFFVFIVFKKNDDEGKSSVRASKRGS